MHDASRDPDVTAPARVGAAPAPAVGTTWGRYHLRERLGEGGMGVVFAAFDPALDREVALKVLHDEQLSRAGQERLRREARALAQVSHPNVVPVYEVGEHAGRLYYTMERVRGRSVLAWAREPRGWREVQRVFVDTARGLAAIHGAGLVHRDVKPGNILIGDDGRARLADLGLVAGAAGPGGTEVVLTTTLRGAGTPAYMAPEQLDGAPGDARSDQFSFGVALDETLHGRPPFGGDTALARREAISRGPAPPARKVPRWLDSAARRAMAADPQDRFPTIVDLLEALTGPRARRWPFAVAGTIGVAAVATAVALTGRSPGVDTSCASARELLAGVWDDGAKARGAAAFAATGRPHAAASWAVVAARLDGYASAWVRAQDAVCEARRARRESEASLDRQVLCLNQRRDQLRTLVQHLDGADGKLVDESPRLARAIAPVGECLDPAALADLAASGDGDGRARLLRSSLHRLAGQYEQALALATEVVAAAQAARDPALEAEALVQQALAALELGRGAAALPALQAALARAEGHPRIVVDAWLQSGIALQRLGRLDEAEAALDQAEQALVRAPDPLRELQATQARGTLAGRRGDYAAALASFERNLVQATTHFGEGSIELAPTYTNLATALRRLGRLDEALAATDQATTLVSELGETHPLVLSARRTRAQVRTERGDLEAALAEHRAIAGLQARALPADAPDRAATQASIGVALLLLERPAEAEPELRQALSIQARLEPDGRNTLATRAHLARAIAAQGRHAEALGELTGTLEARARLLGADHVDTADSHWLVAHSLEALGRLDEAATHLARARAIFERQYGERHPKVAEVVAQQARIARARGRR